MVDDGPCASPLSRVALSLGSNLGDSRANIRSAIDALARYVHVEAISNLYSTLPVGVTDQPSFVNAAVVGYTCLDSGELLHAVKEIERHIGRRPTFRWGPRVIDIDIVFYGDQIIDEPELQVPHPRALERAFVLVPLAEIAPEFIHPGVGRTVDALGAEVRGKQGVQLLGEVG